MEEIREIYDELVKKEAKNIVIIDMKHSPIPTEYFVIMSANSETQMKSLRETILEMIDKYSLPLIYQDKEEGLEWVLVDAGDIVFHIFSEDARQFYDLESLWYDQERVKF